LHLFLYFQTTLAHNCSPATYVFFCPLSRYDRNRHTCQALKGFLPARPAMDK